MDCPNCAHEMQDAISSLECVADANLVYATATLDVVKRQEADLTHCRKHVLDTLRQMGADAEISASEEEDLGAQRSWFAKNRQKVLLGISAIALLIGGALEISLGVVSTTIGFYTLAALAGLSYIGPMALSSLRRKTADMNVLMSIAVIGALIMGFLGDTSVFRDAAIVIFLDQIGEWLEGWSMQKTSSSIQGLMELAPEICHCVISDDATEDLPTKDIQVGQIIRVLPGERIALDGVIVKGSTSVDEAPVTGESIAKDKGPEDKVFAGTLNQTGVFTMRVEATQDESTLSKIVREVQDAQTKAAPYQSFVDRFAKVYTPIVVVSAAIVGLGVPLIITTVAPGTSGVWHDWIYRALSLLVVACPCALVISTPVSFVSAITAAARSGVLVKGGATLDAASRIDSIFLDKTGTLTTGNLSVVGVKTIEAKDANEIVGIMSALEENSTHPLARSVVAYAKSLNLTSIKAEDVVEKTGAGLEGRYSGHTYRIGKPDFALSTEDKVADRWVEDFANKGATSLCLSEDGNLIGIIGVADTLRETSITAIRRLHSLGVTPAIMLTGDNEKVAACIAKKTGVDSFYAGLLPEEKLLHVQKSVASGNKVCMVGDGINDAPALAAASLGVSMGKDASDTALEVADCALLSQDLLTLAGLISLSRHTMRVVRENIGFAIGIKLLVFVLIIIGKAGMGAAVFADTGVALLVILNGMRLMLDRSFKSQ